MNSASLESLQEFLKLFFLDKWLPQAQTIFYLEGAQGILNLPAANPCSYGLGISFLMHETHFCKKSFKIEMRGLRVSELQGCVCLYFIYIFYIYKL